MCVPYFDYLRVKIVSKTTTEAVDLDRAALNTFIIISIVNFCTPFRRDSEGI